MYDHRNSLMRQTAFHQFVYPGYLYLILLSAAVETIVDNVAFSGIQIRCLHLRVPAFAFHSMHNLPHVIRFHAISREAMYRSPMHQDRFIGAA